MDVGGWILESPESHRVMDDNFDGTRESTCQAINKFTGLIAKATMLEHNMPNSRDAQNKLSNLAENLIPLVGWKHENVGQIYDCHVVEWTSMTVYSEICGNPLMTTLAKFKPLNEDFVKLIILQVLHGLKALWDKGLYPHIVLHQLRVNCEGRVKISLLARNLEDGGTGRRLSLAIVENIIRELLWESKSARDFAVFCSSHQTLTIEDLQKHNYLVELSSVTQNTRTDTLHGDGCNGGGPSIPATVSAGNNVECNRTPGLGNDQGLARQEIISILEEDDSPRTSSFYGCDPQTPSYLIELSSSLRKANVDTGEQNQSLDRQIQVSAPQRRRRRSNTRLPRRTVEIPTSVLEVCTCPEDKVYVQRGCMNDFVYQKHLLPLPEGAGLSNRKEAHKVVQEGTQFCLFAGFYGIKDGKGRGLIALQKIGKGKMIFEYSGDLLTNEQSVFNPTTYMYEIECHQMSTAYKKFMTYRVDGDHIPMVIDASSRGNASRFLNHSCDPNVEVVQQHALLIDLIKARGVFPLIFRAKREIAKGEELCVDYHPSKPKSDFENCDDKKMTRCLCESEACRGWILVR